MDIIASLGRAVSDAQLRANVHRCTVVRIWLTPEDAAPITYSSPSGRVPRLRCFGLPVTICAGGVSRVVLEDGYVVRV